MAKHSVPIPVGDDDEFPPVYRGKPKPFEPDFPDNEDAAMKKTKKKGTKVARKNSKIPTTLRG